MQKLKTMKYILTILIVFSSLFCFSQGIRATLWSYHDTIVPKIVVDTKNEAFIKDLDKSLKESNFKPILKYLESTVYVNSLSSDVMEKTEDTEIVRFLNTLVKKIPHYQYRVSFVHEDYLNIYKIDIAYFEDDSAEKKLLTYYFVEMHGKIIGFHAP